ncbi:phosphatidate cytidylyltransferase [Sulfuracidifex tepidarius]|uniref:Phosphatidate cytidylyltransferase n=1 Tax=Sulfuracidifex tepidarius TaxID=1294262 RepID=A0A510E4L9_9CREN|nr:phosphatidate cytidylyltransferase [Sulfuracidifex tepidarius]BBG27472.1 hypothetical protein IC007_2026 [Sulfuracidifex tepidarius]
MFENYVTLNDVLWGIVLTVWVALVTVVISKYVAKLTTIYVARKIIHMLGGGVVAILSPFIFSSPLIPILDSYLLMGILLYVRFKKEGFNWFQEEGNYGEIFFTFSFGTLLLLMWVIDPNYWYSNDVFIAILPLIFMSFGDGVTGIIRNYVYKRRVKGLWGSLGMLVFSAIVGYVVLSIPGLIAGVIATVVEVLPLVDDNISIPFASFAVLYLLIKVF